MAAESPFLRNDDVPVEGPARELVGAPHPLEVLDAVPARARPLYETGDAIAAKYQRTYGLEFDPDKSWDEKKEVYRLSNEIVRTQNVTQTGQLLQVRRAHDIFLRQLATILTTLADLALLLIGFFVLVQATDRRSLAGQTRWKVEHL